MFTGRRVAGCAVAAIVAVAAGPPAPVGADSGSKDHRIAQVQAQLGEASRAEVAASAQLRALQDRRAALDHAVAGPDAPSAGGPARPSARGPEGAAPPPAAPGPHRR